MFIHEQRSAEQCGLLIEPHGVACGPEFHPLQAKEEILQDAWHAYRWMHFYMVSAITVETNGADLQGSRPHLHRSSLSIRFLWTGQPTSLEDSARPLRTKGVGGDVFSSAVRSTVAVSAMLPSVCCMQSPHNILGAVLLDRRCESDCFVICAALTSEATRAFCCSTLLSPNSPLLRDRSS